MTEPREISLERLWDELNAAAQHGRAAASTVEALMYSLCERGATALTEPDTERRISELSEEQLHEVGALLQALEIVRAWIAEDIEQLVVRLLLLTGARKGEVLAMEWGALDLGAGIWTKLGSTTKQKSDHVVPLSAPARQLERDAGRVCPPASQEAVAAVCLPRQRRAWPPRMRLSQTR
jgi:integrase